MNQIYLLNNDSFVLFTKLYPIFARIKNPQVLMTDKFCEKNIYSALDQGYQDAEFGKYSTNL